MTKVKKKFKRPRPQLVAELPLTTASTASEPETQVNKSFAWFAPFEAAWLFATLGIAVFASGFASPFMGDDDLYQITNNVPVHSIANIVHFFQVGTYSDGAGLAAGGGSYYRPLMMTAYSVIYTLFGPSAGAFHVFQAFLCIASAFVLYLVFRFSFNNVLAFILALIFLVHPLNSQVAFAIPSLQEPLCFFFGILALWFLLKFDSTKYLLVAIACLFLSMLSKETGIVFVAICAMYLFLFNRERLKSFAFLVVVPIALFVAMRLHAVGLFTNTANPIDTVNLAGRLMTAPSIVSFYLTKFIFPWRLASGYFWVYGTFSIQRVLLPLLIDVAFIASLTYLALCVRKRASRAQYYTYLFFAIWAGIGLLPYLQIIPLDTTACEPWFYVSMAGLLGAFGVIVNTFRVSPKWILIIGAALVAVLGIRTAYRGLDWNNSETLASKDIVASPQDYNSYNILASDYLSQDNYVEAKSYAQHSVELFPTYTNYCNLGVSLASLGDYSAAIQAYNDGLKYANYLPIYENMATLTLVTGNPASSGQFFKIATGLFPQDSKLWLYLALLQAEHGGNAEAKIAISIAAQYSSVPPAVDNAIMNDQVLTIPMPQFQKTITIK